MSQRRRELWQRGRILVHLIRSNHAAKVTPELPDQIQVSLFVDEYSPNLNMILDFPFGFVGGWSGTARPSTRKTGVPDVFERGETFMSNPASSAGPDLDGLTALKALEVGCISPCTPRVAHWEQPSSNCGSVVGMGTKGMKIKIFVPWIFQHPSP